MCFACTGIQMGSKHKLKVQESMSEPGIDDLYRSVSDTVQNRFVVRKNGFGQNCVGIDNPGIATQISEYNSKLLERNSLVSHSSEN